ncbi:unnamed protein product [Microthlaspi erraticum]|uniref:TF-B3 domain-containing protein n=1 Tax=Microthlaspi erraticum TaxID=1685480 RepID=A0A6D2I0U8_9BRAS|nr:unnamed protein product [Microthlaspi erraticum]
MAKSSDFGSCKEERMQEAFFKVIQGIDIYSENMRAFPHDFVRNFSDKELSEKMKITTKWGRSWQVKISKNPIFYFMERSGWEKFVRENFLGEHEYLSFTHKGNMSFVVNIYKQDGTEMLQPRQSTTFLASSSKVKTEQGEAGVSNGVKKEEVVSSELNNHGPKTAESNGGGKKKRKHDSGLKKAEEPRSFKRTKKVVTGRRNSVGASSSTTAAEFTIEIMRSYLTLLGVPKSFGNDHMPKTTTTFKIHHTDAKKSWDVVYCAREKGSFFSGGWVRLAREYPLQVGNICKFTLIKPDELVLVRL